MESGTIRRWFFERGYGFILNRDANDVFCHIRDFLDYHDNQNFTPNIGDTVQYDVVKSDKGPQAKNIAILK